MADVSTQLRAARERAGLSLEDISARTKIKLSQLQALEGGRFERLPGEFFTRAFIKTYAREVHLPPDEVIREYDASRSVAERPPDAPPVAPETAAPVLRPSAERDSEALTTPRVLGAVAFAGLVLLVLFAVNRQPQRAAEPGAISAAGTQEAAAQAAPTSGSTPPPPPETVSMEIAPTAEIWINASADGKRVLYRLVQPGERLKVEARDELSFRIGNAAAFEYTVNGARGRALGQSGEVVEFKVTPANVGTYRR